MTHYYSTDKAHIFWDEVIESVVIRWNSFAQGDGFREPLDKMIELAVIKNAKKALFDNSHLLILAEDMKWLSDEWLPRLRNAGIKYTATVNPSNSVIDRDMNQSTSSKAFHHEFKGIHHALSWLSEIAA